MNDLVDILLATYNGVEFIETQLKSIEAQTHKNWRIWASDDCSSDGTVEILEKWALKLGPKRMQILNGPRQGFVANFQSLIGNLNINGNYIAFCDQDDVWMNFKLERALKFLHDYNPNFPAMYCSRTVIINKYGIFSGSLSPLFNRQPSFANAIVQNIAGGNTMVLNSSAHKLMSSYSYLRPISHDWWAYLIVSGVSGYIFYDYNASIYYRQHENNLIGQNNNWFYRYQRIKFLISGGFYNWNNINIECLDIISKNLTDDNRKILIEFKSIRSSGFFIRLIRTFNNSFYRQTHFGNIALKIAFVLNKI